MMSPRFRLYGNAVLTVIYVGFSQSMVAAAAAIFAFLAGMALMEVIAEERNK